MTTIPQKPGATPLPGMGKAPPTAEQLKRARETLETLDHLTTEDAPPASPEELPPGQGEDAARPLPRPDSRSRPGGTGEKPSTYEKDEGLRDAARLPREIGYKISVAPRVPQQRPLETRPDYARRGDEAPRHGPPRRPFPLEPSPRQVRAILKDPVFRGPLKGSPLHQRLLERALAGEHARHGETRLKGEKELLTRGELGQLFALRFKLRHKREGRDVLRHELTRAREDRRQKVQALRYEAKPGEGGAETAAAGETGETAGDAVRERLAEKLADRLAESPFEQVLQEVLTGGRASVPDIPASARARFAAKTAEEWEGFFKNALNLSSAEIESSAQLDRLIEALYRGLYRRGADGKLMLVSDLAFTDDGGIVEHKYSRVALADEHLLRELENLRPGDSIGEELLKRLGEEFLFLRLAHVVPDIAASEEQGRALLRELSRQVSSSSQRGLEEALERRRRSVREESELPNPSSAYAGGFPDAKERRPGPPRLYMYLLYGVTAAAAGLILTILARAFF